MVGPCVRRGFAGRLECPGPISLVGRCVRGGFGVVRVRRDQQRTAVHQRDRQSKPRFPPVAIRVDTHHPGADWAHQEAYGEDRGRAQQLRGLVLLGEEDRREIDRQDRISVPVLPFDQIAGRSADDALDPAERPVGDLLMHAAWRAPSRRRRFRRSNRGSARSPARRGRTAGCGWAG